MVRTLVISVWFLLHPVHVTLTSIEFVPEAERFNVFVRMYFDDFLTDSKNYREELTAGDFSSGTPSSRAATEKYLAAKLIIKVNEKLLSGKLQDMNVAENEISMNVEYSGGRKPKTINVINQIMTSLYADMSNMVIVRVSDFEEGVKLTSDITQQIFNIK
jgi:hypothetical protein